MPTKHPTPPTPDQGAIAVWAEREHAVSAFRISAPAGAVQVLDLDLRDVLPAASPAAVEETLGPIVDAYKRSSAWRLAQVLEALGVDASARCSPPAYLPRSVVVITPGYAEIRTASGATHLVPNGDWHAKRRTSAMARAASLTFGRPRTRAVKA